MAKIATAVLETKVVGTDQVQRGLKNVDNAMHRTANTSKAVNNQFRLMRGGLGQVGHQIQDVAVQLQMGQNMLLVFGQQGGQIASLFGSKGAVVGAIIAVGAAISTAMLPSLFAGAKALKELEKEGENLADRFDDLDEFFRSRAIDQTNEQIEALESVIDKANGKIAKASRLFSFLDVGLRKSGTRFDKVSNIVKEQTRIIADANKKIETLRAKIDNNTDAFKKFDEELKKELTTLELSQAAIKILEIQTSNMTDAEKELATQMAIAIALRNEQIKSNEDATKQEEKRLDLFAKTKTRLEEQLALIGASKLATDEYRISLMDLKPEEQQQLQRLLESIKRKQEKHEEDKKAEEQADKQRQSFERLNKSLDEEIEKLKNGEKALDLFKIAQMELTDEQKKALIQKQKIIHGYEEEEQKIKDNADAAEKALRELEKQQDQFRDAYMPLFNEFGDGFADAITGAQNFAEAMKGVAKSVIDSLIRMAIQKMIVDQLFAGFMNMFAPQQQTTSLGSALSQASQAGYGIKGFEGGGFTGYGSRSGGLDGRGGFMAMLHPNETVVDHTKGSGGGVVIQQTINVTTGVQQTVRAEIATLMPQIAQATKAAVADARMRGGNFSKSMVGA